MEKIIRLSWANIRKHRIETVSLVILVMLCMLLAGSSFSGSIGIKTIFPQLMEQTRSYENYILIDDKAYDKEYEEILRKDSRVENMAVSELLYSMSSNFLNEAGKEQGMFMAFITEDNNAGWSIPTSGKRRFPMQKSQRWSIRSGCRTQQRTICI